ncbi:recQ [Mytilus edulis]|uniref:DNA 3'-5' helicase n=1 Tax=Mytilus edulis TaxID=6550 RepID=A0A8S3TYJ1_MYTED|nr:recQ [Mytilus edulis]
MQGVGAQRTANQIKEKWRELCGAARFNIDTTCIPSFCPQALPYIGEDSKCCLVINGLNAIIEEQEKRFGDRCINITDEVLKLLEKDDNPDLMHSTKAKMKALITHRMHETHDSLRLVFATEAYGTGIDVPDIKQIIHVGPPNTMETYVQEIGRCGRNGQQATAVLYYNNTDIAAML